MKPLRLVSRIAAPFFCLALAAPSPAFGLRPGVENRTPKEVAAGLEEIWVAGMPPDAASQVLAMKGMRPIPGREELLEWFPSPLTGLIASSGRKSPEGVALYDGFLIYMGAYLEAKKGGRKLILDLGFAPDLPKAKRLDVASKLLEMAGGISTDGRPLAYVRKSDRATRTFFEGINRRIRKRNDREGRKGEEDGIKEVEIEVERDPEPIAYVGPASAFDFHFQRLYAPRGAEPWLDGLSVQTMFAAMAEARDFFQGARVLAVRPLHGSFGLAALSMFGASQLMVTDEIFWPLYTTRINALQLGISDRVRVSYGFLPAPGQAEPFDVILHTVWEPRQIPRFLKGAEPLLAPEGIVLLLALGREGMRDAIQTEGKKAGFLIHTIRWQGVGRAGVFALTLSDARRAQLGAVVPAAGLEEGEGEKPALEEVSRREFLREVGSGAAAGVTAAAGETAQAVQQAAGAWAQWLAIRRAAMVLGAPNWAEYLFDSEFFTELIGSLDALLVQMERIKVDKSVLEGPAGPNRQAVREAVRRGQFSMRWAQEKWRKTLEETGILQQVQKAAAQAREKIATGDSSWTEFWGALSNDPDFREENWLIYKNYAPTGGAKEIAVSVARTGFIEREVQGAVKGAMGPRLKEIGAQIVQEAVQLQRCVLELPEEEQKVLQEAADGEKLPDPAEIREKALRHLRARGVEIRRVEEIAADDPKLGEELRAAGRSHLALLPAMVADAPPAQAPSVAMDLYAHDTVVGWALSNLPDHFDLSGGRIRILPKEAEQANEWLKEADETTGRRVVVALDHDLDQGLALPPLALILRLDPATADRINRNQLAAFLANPNRLLYFILDLTSGSIRKVTLRGREFYALELSA